jgi:antitoxin YefM
MNGSFGHARDSHHSKFAARKRPFPTHSVDQLPAILVQYIAQVEIAMRVINFSEARNSLKQVIDQVVSDADIAVIARRDAPDAVVMSLDTYNSMMETVHLLKVPANAAHLARSIEQLRKGKVKAHGLVEA